MRGDFEAYLNDSFRGPDGTLNLDELLAREDLLPDILPPEQ